MPSSSSMWSVGDTIIMLSISADLEFWEIYEKLQEWNFATVLNTWLAEGN